MIRKSINNLFFNRKLLNFAMLNETFNSQKPPQKIPEINQVKKDWNDFTQGYRKIDLGPQTFYYSFLTLMNLQSAKNVLEVACGTGRLLPVAVGLKS